MTGAVVKGWCPGALRPMASGDGLIVRLRISGGIVDTGLAAAIARWSRRWGSGRIDLSSRANLQLRGLSAETLPFLHDALAQRGLLDSDGAREALRNVISSPLAGIDPDTVLDTRPIVWRLEQRLVSDAALRDLPAKFGFAIDDGGRLGLAGVPADVRFEACRKDEGPAFVIGLAGAPNDRFGPCRPDTLAAVAAALGSAFLDLRKGFGAGIRRIGDLVAALGGVRPLAHAAGLAPVDLPCIAGRASRPQDFLGVRPLRSAAFVGVGLPFGGIVAEEFARLALLAAEQGATELRLTPWRAILVPLPSLRAARAVSIGLPAASFILDPDDPRLRIAACPGAPWCAQGMASARRDAALLAAAVTGASGSGVVLHVSGCEKGCAHPRPAPITLVGRNGRYDLVRNGVPSDMPELRELSADQAGERVRRIIAAHPHGGGG